MNPIIITLTTFFIVGLAHFVRQPLLEKCGSKKAASLRSAGNRSLRSRMLLTNRFLDNFNFLVSQPVQLVDDLINQRVSRLDLRLQLLSPRFGLDIPL